MTEPRDEELEALRTSFNEYLDAATAEYEAQAELMRSIFNGRTDSAQLSSYLNEQSLPYYNQSVTELLAGGTEES